jgi:hypothetical protein
LRYYSAILCICGCKFLHLRNLWLAPPATAFSTLACFSLHGVRTLWYLFRLVSLRNLRNKWID